MNEYTSTFGVLLALLAVASCTPTLEHRKQCHYGLRQIPKREGEEVRAGCHAYKTDPKELASEDGYGTLPDICFNLTWWQAHANSSKVFGTTGPWGNCVNHTQDDDWHYFVSNNVPPYYFDPYCPFGLLEGYCIDGEPCPFPDIKCGITKSQGFTEYGDIWVSAKLQMKITKHPNPTLSDLPRDMYEAANGAQKNMGPVVGVNLNGVNIQGPNDAGGVNVDEAGFQLMCGGHVTPPVQHAQPHGPPATPPLYHYHKAADCTPAFKKAVIPVSHGGTPHAHGDLVGYANDGFGIYAYADQNGAAPVLDECNGHFGAVDDNGTLEYHYHATTATPYHLACQGPALGKCASVQHETDFCGYGCGAEVCVQPGTNKEDLNTYLNQFNSTWLSSYSVNDF